MIKKKYLIKIGLFLSLILISSILVSPKSSTQQDCGISIVGTGQSGPNGLFVTIKNNDNDQDVTLCIQWQCLCTMPGCTHPSGSSCKTFHIKKGHISSITFSIQHIPPCDEGCGGHTVTNVTISCTKLTPTPTPLPTYCDPVKTGCECLTTIEATNKALQTNTKAVKCDPNPCDPAKYGANKFCYKFVEAYCDPTPECECLTEDEAKQMALDTNSTYSLCDTKPCNPSIYGNNKYCYKFTPIPIPCKPPFQCFSEDKIEKKRDEGNWCIYFKSSDCLEDEKCAFCIPMVGTGKKIKVDTDTEKDLKDAFTKIDEGDYEGAINPLKKAKDYYVEKGDVESVNALEELIDKCEKYIHLKDEASYLFERGEEQYDQGLYEHAKENFEKAKQNYEELGDTEMVNECNKYLHLIEEAMKEGGLGIVSVMFGTLIVWLLKKKRR